MEASKESAKLEAEAFAANQARLDKLFEIQEAEKARLAAEKALKERPRSSALIRIGNPIF